MIFRRVKLSRKSRLVANSNSLKCLL